MSKSPPQSAKLVQFKAKPSATTPESASTALAECPQCASLRAQVGELLEQRDRALKSLAEEREISNALRLGHSGPSHYVGSHVRYRKGERPLRYQVADAANHILKTYLGFLHLATRETAGKVFQLAKRLGRNIEP